MNIGLKCVNKTHSIISNYIYANVHFLYPVKTSEDHQVKPFCFRVFLVFSWGIERKQRPENLK